MKNQLRAAGAAMPSQHPRRDTLLPAWAVKRRVLIAVLPVAFWIASVAVAAVWPRLYTWLALEDHLLETIQNLTLVSAVVVGLLAARELQRQGLRWWSLLYVIGSIGLIWLLGEEVSWGQRIFGWDTPEVLGHNLQGESNLHNLPGVMATVSGIVFISIPVLVTASWILWSRGDAVARRARLHLWLPHPVLATSWLCYWSYDLLREVDKWYFNSASVQPVVSRLQESAEVILYGAILMFLAMALSSPGSRRGTVGSVN